MLLYVHINECIVNVKCTVVCVLTDHFSYCAWLSYMYGYLVVLILCVYRPPDLGFLFWLMRILKCDFGSQL